MSLDEKRTWRVSATAIEVVEWMAENTPYNKQESVDRMIKYYAREAKRGNLDDPVVAEALEGNVDDILDGASDDESNRSIIDKLRGDK